MAQRKISRRVVISAVAGATSLPEVAAALPRLADNVRQLSGDWLALKQREEILTARWSTIESWLVEQFDWGNLSEEEQQALPEAQELREIDDQLDQLEEERLTCRARLLNLPPATLEGTLGKLRALADLIEPADQPFLHQHLLMAMDELEGVLAAPAAH